ncbi:MAG: hypothetical protein IK048_01645 [Clostridia bacterium]|nr:hypothetical protein [Clostridia bacterium]
MSKLFHKKEIEGVEVMTLDGAEVGEKIKKRNKIKLAVWIPLGLLILVFVLNIIVLPLTSAGARTSHVEAYGGDNQYITFDNPGGLYLSAHRAGGDLAPEETKSAFRLCMEADYTVDVLEFDVHLTKDNKLVLLHDHELARTSNGEQLFFKGVKICDLTLDELKTVNFGYNFKDPETDEYVYRRDMTPAEIAQKEIGIFPLEEILDYIENEARKDGGMHYVIEIKDKGERGRKSMDILYESMVAHGILDRTIVGTFNGDITDYIDKEYKGKVTRSAGIVEVVNFYYSFLWGTKLNVDKLGFRVLQIPTGLNGFFDFSTQAFIDYAHTYGIAVQYWTINDAETVKKLQSNGADCIMTDNPAMAYEALGRTN